MCECLCQCECVERKISFSAYTHNNFFFGIRLPYVCLLTSLACRTEVSEKINRIECNRIA